MHALSLQLAETWRLRALLRQMTLREVQASFRGSVLGVFWIYAQPLLTIAAYYLVFDVILEARLGESAPTRAVGVYLIAGMVPWMAFSDAVSRSMRSLLDASALLQKNALSPVLFPARAVLASALTYLPPLMLAGLAISAIQGFSLALFWLPVLIAMQYLLAFLCGYALAVLSAAMRDVLQLAGFCLSLGVFASPVLFTIDMVPAGYAWLFWLNPMTPVILGCQSILLLGQVPSASVWLPLVVWLFVMSVLVNRLIVRSQEHLVDWL
jgi:lipopolysaccharide transport system permease protein